jgi:Asp/Glu/hydantoin racemase
MKPIRIWYQSYVDEENGAVYWARLREHLASIVDPGTMVDIKGITPHDSYAHPIVEFRCAREVICNAVRAEREGYDAMVIGHFQDAGLYEARSVTDLPVLALGEASMLHACQLGQTSGIVTINTRYIPWFKHQIGKYGLERRVAGVHAMSFEPGQILKAYESDALADGVAELFERQAKPLVAQGVDVLIPGGGIPMLLFSRLVGHQVDGAPVINGIPIVVKMAEMAVKLRRLTGLGVSRVSDFIKPPPDIIEEFMTHPKGL